MTVTTARAKKKKKNHFVNLRPDGRHFFPPLQHKTQTVQPQRDYKGSINENTFCVRSCACVCVLSRFGPANVHP